MAGKRLYFAFKLFGCGFICPRIKMGCFWSHSLAQKNECTGVLSCYDTPPAYARDDGLGCPKSNFF